MGMLLGSDGRAEERLHSEEADLTSLNYENQMEVHLNCIYILLDHFTVSLYYLISVIAQE